MDREQIVYEHNRITNSGGSHVSCTTFYVCLLIVLPLVLALLVFGPKIIGGGTTILTMLAIMVCSLFLMVITRKARLRDLFRDSSIHSHDDICNACYVFHKYEATHHTQLSPYVRRMVWKCRHDKDEITFHE